MIAIGNVSLVVKILLSLILPAISGDTIVFLGGKDNSPALMAFKLPDGQ